MRKLLGLLLCASACLVISFGSTGCGKKKDPEVKKGTDPVKKDTDKKDTDKKDTDKKDTDKKDTEKKDTDKKDADKKDADKKDNDKKEKGTFLHVEPRYLVGSMPHREVAAVIPNSAPVWYLR